MIQYTIKRIFQTIPVLLGVIVITFILMYMIPGDPVVSMVGERYDEQTIKKLREELKLDDPLPVQFIDYVSNVFQGNFGKSFITGEPVIQALLVKLPNTIILAVTAMVIAIISGLAMGLFASVNQGSVLDRVTMFFALAGISTPVFWMGILFILVFGVHLNWLPPTGFGGVEYIVLPAITLGIRSAAYIARLSRAAMIEILEQDYIRTARMKRLPEWKVLFKHGFPNILIPVITLIGTDFGSYLSGAVLTESIFGWPGIGRFALEAILKRDFPVIQGTVLFMAIVFIFVNLFVDICYGFIDPRIRMENKND